MHDSNSSETFGFLNALSLNLLHFGLKDYQISKQALSTRIIFMTSCFSSFVIFGFYSADLTSLMTSGAKTNTIASFQDARDLGIQVALRSGEALQTIVE